MGMAYASGGMGSCRIQSFDFGLDRMGLKCEGHVDGRRKKEEGALAGMAAAAVKGSPMW